MAKKSDEKKGFKLYNNYIEQFEKLDDRSAGQLIKAIFAYVNGKELPEISDIGADMAFSFICSQLDRDKIAYDEKCEINRRNSKLGGRPKKTENQTVQEKPNGFQKNRSVSADTQEPTEQPETPETLSTRRTLNYSKPFEQFWEIYPRKDGKGDAYKKYQARLKDGYSEQELYVAAMNYRAQIQAQHTEKRYTKLGRTFLSDSMPFLDYLKQENNRQETSTTVRRDPTKNPFGDNL